MIVLGEPGAPPLICLHGFPDVAEGFEPVGRLLAAGGFRVVAPRLRGYAPGLMEGPFTIEQAAEDLIALAAELSPDAPVPVVGHDWGAMAVYAAAARAPERFGRCVAMSVPHPAALAFNVRRELKQVRRSWYMLFFQLPLAAEWALRRRDFALVTRLWRDWSPAFEPPAEHLARIKRCLDESLPAPIDYYRGYVRNGTFLERSPSVAIPTLYLHGERDGCIGPGLARGQERFFTAGLRSEMLPDVGHFLHLERPAVVADRILDFLRS